MTNQGQDRQLPAPVVKQLPMPETAKSLTIEGQFLTKNDWDVLTQHCFPNAKKAETIELLVKVCASRKLNPLRKPYHIVPTYNSKTSQYEDSIWPGINELLTTASRTNQFAGKDDPVYGPRVTIQYKSRKVDVPEWCKVVVYKLVGGQPRAFSGVIFYEECVALKDGNPNAMWSRRYRGQMAKCALAEALRIAFPEECGGEPTAEEMEEQVDAEAQDQLSDGQLIRRKAEAKAAERVANMPMVEEEEIDAEVLDPTDEEKAEAELENAIEQRDPLREEAARKDLQEARGIDNASLVNLNRTAKENGWTVKQVIDYACTKFEFTPEQRTKWQDQLTKAQFEHLKDHVSKNQPAQQ